MPKIIRELIGLFETSRDNLRTMTPLFNAILQAWNCSRRDIHQIIVYASQEISRFVVLCAIGEDLMSV